MKVEKLWWRDNNYFYNIEYFRKHFVSFVFQKLKNFPIQSEDQILFLNKKYFTTKRISYECKYLKDCLYSCFDTSSKKWPKIIFEIIDQNSKSSLLEQAKIV